MSTDVAGGRGRWEALLWSAPSGRLPAPPVDTRAQVLPVGDLEWSDAERLFLRLLHTVRPVQYAKLFGVPGQDQAGIDAYARLPLDLTASESGGRDYITLQSRRIKTLTAGKIKKAVDDLLAGEWAKNTAAFHFATSFDLQDTKLDTPIREQTERLAKLGIAFVPWGVQEISGLLKDQPRIVDDFFGRAWVERFCGIEAAQALADNLDIEDSRDLRAELRVLYQAVFSAQGGNHPIENADQAGGFVVLDVDPIRHRSADSGDQDGTEPQADRRHLPDHAGENARGGYTHTAARPGARRQSFRSAIHLLQRTRQTESGAVGSVPADEWLADGKYRLLVGRPGAGKSSLLRFVATDLLSSHPQSVVLQREHATDLPIWLPFGYLCRHLEASTENSLVSGAHAWLKSQSAEHLWPLVQRALRDDRLLLLVDGVDEWSDVGAAERALGMLEAFLGRTEACAIVSTRPYAVDRLNWRRPWAQAEVAPLTGQQRRAIAAAIVQPDPPPARRPSTPAGPSVWDAGVEPFLDQLEVTPELAELSRSPLFLTLLATTWQGEPLPRQRFRIYARLVELLVEKHPQMRQRASHAGQTLLAAAEVTTLFAAVAYRLRVEDPSGTVTKLRMRTLIVESMTDDTVLGYQHGEARKIADAVIAMAEDEFGLIVSHGAGSVGFLHRVVLDHLAGHHLATLAPHEQVEIVQRWVHDPAWRDVLLALLTAQVSPHTTEPLLTAALDQDGELWSDVDGYELLAEALAAGVKLTPKSHTKHLERLIERVETHPSLRHRVNLITALVGTLANHTARTHLLPIMKRWLTATRPDPTATMWSLRNLAIDDGRAAEFLLWGLRHPEDNVKINAARALAHRFGGQQHLLERLVALTEIGPFSATQAAAILALGDGWTDAPETTRLVDWARCQPSLPLRLVALQCVRERAPGDGVPYRPEERDWLLSLLRHERSGSEPWGMAESVAVAASGGTTVADFAFQTLTSKGPNGGNRGLAWYLACTTFAEDRRFKDWTAAELAAPEKHGLILYNTDLIPEQWRADPAFAAAVQTYVDNKVQDPTRDVVALTTSLQPTDAKTALLKDLDSWRPYAAARALAERYADDKRVQTELTNRLRGEFTQAAPLAGVAIDVLGPTDGFAVLMSLLRHPRPDAGLNENHVVLAEAVATAWTRFESTVRDTDADADAAQQILARYDPAELATLCTAGRTHPLTWHVPAVITAWPGQPTVQDFASRLLHDPDTITSGLLDTIPGVILRVYGARTDSAAIRLVDQTLALSKHLDPELREVLAFELARSSLTVTDLIDVLAESTNDPDSEIRRTAGIGLIQAIKRHQQTHHDLTGTDTSTPEIDWLRARIKQDLCAYGPELDQRRQLAWIGMLMLDDLTLMDGLEETIGHTGVPGVGLDANLTSDVDQILVDLIAQNWERLLVHFGDGLFERLNTTSARQRRTADEQRRHAMSALATVATRYPAVAEELRREADRDPSLRQDPNFLLWAKDENRADESVLRALVTRLNPGGSLWGNRVLDSVLDLGSWNVPDEKVKATLAEHMIFREPHGAEVTIELAIYTQLFPTDSLSIAAVADLENWFRASPKARTPLDWDDLLAIAFGAAKPSDLPVIAVRAHTRLRLHASDWDMPQFTKPLLRRLRTDTDTVDAFASALRSPMTIRENTPILAGPWDPIVDAHPELHPLQRTYLFGVLLRHVGALSQQDTDVTMRTLQSASPDTVVHNPFTNRESPLRLAALDLAMHRQP